MGSLAFLSCLGVFSMCFSSFRDIMVVLRCVGFKDNESYLLGHEKVECKKKKKNQKNPVHVMMWTPYVTT